LCWKVLKRWSLRERLRRCEGVGERVSWMTVGFWEPNFWRARMR
jgi:hypothetical protein